MIVDGNKLGNAGYNYLGVPYKQLDCQAFVERCLADCGLRMDLAGSNAWYREVRKNGWTGTPEECTAIYGGVPTGAFLFILLHDGGEPEKYKPDGLGNASHIGICTGTRGEGAIHSSSSRGCVCESKFKGRTIPNGGWNMVGLWNSVDYVDFPDEQPAPDPGMPTLCKGSKGEYVTLMQTKLIQQGYDLTPYGADGKFGNITAQALVKFQNDHGLEPDAVCGPRTWEALSSGQTERYTVTIRGVSRTVAEGIIHQYGGSMEREA